MAYPDKPSGEYILRDYDFAQADSKKIPMDEYLFKNGYKNAEESETESVPDAHSQNWLFDILHRNLKYAIGTADENKRIISELPDIYEVLKKLYPVGSIYITTNSECPLSYFFGTWSLVSSGKALWTGNGTNGNTTINAGLPAITHTHSGTTDGQNAHHTHTRGSMNITGSFGADDRASSYAKGAFSRFRQYEANTSASGGDDIYYAFDFNASKTWTGSTSQESAWHGHGFTTGNNSGVNSIYGANSTVQPPAYVINAFRRTA